MTAIATPTRTAVTPAELPARPRLADSIRHTFTLAWRGIVQVKYNPMELTDFSVQPVMFILLFTYVFGGAIAGSTSDYLLFALPGLMVQNALFATLNMGVALNTDLHKGVFDRLRSLPIARWTPLAGRILADMAKQAWAFVLLLGVGLLLGFRAGTGVWGVLAAGAVLLGFAFCFAWIAVLVGVLVDDPEQVQVFGFTTIMPLTFTSNAFVDSATMPGWLRTWVDVNPVSYLADTLRGLMVSGPVGGPLLRSALWAVAILGITAPLAVRALRRRV